MGSKNKISSTHTHLSNNLSSILLVDKVKPKVSVSNCLQNRQDMGRCCTSNILSVLVLKRLYQLKKNIKTLNFLQEFMIQKYSTSSKKTFTKYVCRKVGNIGVVNI